MFPSPSGSNQRRGIVAAFMVFMFSFMTTRPAGSAQTSLMIHSEPGDPVGGGFDYYYTTAQGSFSVQRNTRSGVTVTFSSFGGLTWNMQFAAPGNQPLTPGVWLDAVTFSANDVTRAGIQVWGLGRSCPSVTGTVQIKQVTYGLTGNVTAFWAVFSQQCDGSPAVLTGDLRWRADLPVCVTAPPRGSTVRGGEVYFDVNGASALSAVSLTAAGLPDAAGFWDNGNGTGSFDWFTAPAQVGRHVITFYARNLAGAVDSAVTLIDVTGITGFRAESDSTDYVGQGTACSLSPEDAVYSVREENGAVVVSVQAAGGSLWNMTFTGADGAPLARGTYSNAAMPGTPGRPGLDVTLDGRNCTDLSGEFEVKELVRNDQGGIQSFRAVFEQQCGASSAAMRGDIRCNAGVPIDVVAPLEIMAEAGGQEIMFFVVASDPWYNPLNLSAAGMPVGATFTDMGDNSGVFRWTPGLAQGGAYHIAFTADDPNGRLNETVTTRIAVHSSARPPMAEAGPYLSGNAGDVIRFDGSGSTSTDGRPLLSYTWNFGDGTTGTGAIAEHAYATAGSYAVLLTVCTDVFCTSDSTAAVIAPGATLPGTLAARAFTAAGTNPLRLDNQRPQYSIYFEPADSAWTLSQVDPTTVTLYSAGTGSVDRIRAATVTTSAGADRDRNGVPDLDAAFPMADMRKLLGNVPNRTEVSLLLAASLTNGATVEAPVTIQVNTTGNFRRLSATGDPGSEIRFSIDEPGFVRVRLYDISGRVVATLVEQDLAAGDHAVAAQGNAAGGSLPQGIYFFRVETPQGGSRGRVVVTR